MKGERGRERERVAHRDRIANLCVGQLSSEKAFAFPVRKLSANSACRNVRFSDFISNFFQLIYKTF